MLHCGMRAFLVIGLLAAAASAHALELQCHALTRGDLRGALGVRIPRTVSGGVSCTATDVAGGFPNQSVSVLTVLRKNGTIYCGTVDCEGAGSCLPTNTCGH
jgi:hypothetical protein